jgi:VCBS repeat-containing protein
MRGRQALSGWWLAWMLGGVGFSAALPLRAQPVASDDSYATQTSVPLTVDEDDGVLANDRPGADDDEDDDDDDDDEEELEAELVSTTQNGSLQLDPDGGFVYEPNSGFSGADTFSYRATNGSEQSNVATVTINVEAVGGGNTPPVAVADSYSVAEGAELVVSGSGVLTNDTDAENATLTAMLVDNVRNGTLAFNADGSFRYTPRDGFDGDDSFRYRANDGSASSDPATVAITVAAVNEAPVARDDSYSMNEGGTLNVNAGNGVLGNDSDTDEDDLTAVLVSDPSTGTLTLNANGSFRFVPATGFSGAAVFTYRATDGTTSSSAANVTITVAASNDAPVARADHYTTDEGQTLTVNVANGVLGNDTDADDDELTAVLSSEASSGTLTLNANGSFSYVPAADFTGNATFAYQADDGTARSTPVTVTIAVNSVNVAPSAQPDSFTTREDEPLSAGGRGVLGNDSDPDGDSLTAERVSNVTTGTLQLNTNGTFTYTPPANFSGEARFTYRARDADESSAAVTVTITVSPVNDAPFVTNSPPAAATEGRSYRYTLAASDPDDDDLTIAAPQLPGWLSFAAPGTIAGTPSQDDVGGHDVTMTVSDGTAPVVERKFRITVAAVDDAPSISPIPEQTATEAREFDFDLARFVTDDDTAASELKYAPTGALPRGLTLSAAGRLSGTPEVGASVGAHTVPFTVADATTTVAGQLTLVVLAAGRVDLATAMSVTPNPATLDAPVTWTVTITNRAAQVEATGVSLEAVFVGDVPFRFDAPATPGCTLTPSGDQGRLVCTLGPIGGGASTTVSMTGRGSFAGDVIGQAVVAIAAGGALDETPSNDRASASLSIAQRIATAAAQSIDVAGAQAVAAGDFDADGFDDLAVATASAQGLVVLMNVVDPTNPNRRTFAMPPLSLGGEALPNDVVAVDLDRDGDLDLVTAAGEGAPNRAFLNASGTFTSVSLGDDGVDSRAVAAGDVNGDGFVDLVFPSSGMSTVLINSGAGAVFTRAAGIGPHAARDALLVDLFSDSLPELVVAAADGGAAVYSNTGGTLTLAATLATGATRAAATGDFNADGRADVALARDTADFPAMPSTSVWLATADSANPFFVADELGAAPATGLLVNDFNLDSRADVLTINEAGMRIFTNAGAANGTFLLHGQQVAAPGVRAAAMGKFSNDDRVDVVLVGEGVKVLVNNGNGDFGAPDSTPPVIQLRGPATVDVTIDGTYSDAGATASDAQDGDLTSRIVVTNPVNTTVLGTYTVTYAVSDLSGNAAVPVTRTVNVQPQAAAVEGGGGALGMGTLASLFAILLMASFRGCPLPPRALDWRGAAARCARRRKATDSSA